MIISAKFQMTGINLRFYSISVCFQVDYKAEDRLRELLPTKFCSVRETRVQSTLADYYSITSLICNYNEMIELVLCFLYYRSLKSFPKRTDIC